MPMDMNSLAQAAEASLKGMTDAQREATQKLAEHAAALDAGKQAVIEQMKALTESRAAHQVTNEDLKKFADGLGKGTDAVAAPFVALGRLASEVVSGFQQVTGAVAGFVQASNPAEMQRFQLAMQDLSASLGVALEPIIKAGEQVADLFNEMFTELQPVIGPVIQQLADVFTQLGRAAVQLFEPILRAVVPVLNQLIEALRPLLPSIQLVARAFGDLFAELIRSLQPLIQQVIPPLVEWLRRLADTVAVTVTTFSVLLERLSNFDFAGAADLGAVIAEAMRRVEQNRQELAQPPRPRPRTAAARQAQLAGIEQVGQNARLAAFGSRSQAELQQEANSLLQQIAENTANLEDLDPELIAEAAAQAWQTLQAAGNALGGLLGI